MSGVETIKVKCMRCGHVNESVHGVFRDAELVVLGKKCTNCHRVILFWGRHYHNATVWTEGPEVLMEELHAPRDGMAVVRGKNGEPIRTESAHFEGYPNLIPAQTFISEWHVTDGERTITVKSSELIDMVEWYRSKSRDFDG